MKYDITWQHVRAVDNKIADTLSHLGKTTTSLIRSPVGIKQVLDVKENPKNWKNLRKELIKEQQLDEGLKLIVTTNPQSVIVENHGLTRIIKDQKELIYVPIQMNVKIIKAIHKLLLHFGSEKMCAFVNENLIIKNADRICRQVARACDICQRSKHYTRRTERRWNFNLPSEKNQVISADLFGPLPLSEKGNRHILVMIDQFSKKICLRAIRDRKATTIVRTAKKMLNSEYYQCNMIVTDNAKEFHSKEWEKMGYELHNSKINNIL